MYWVFTGGTGGHISPAISIAENMASKDHDVCLFTLQKDINYRGFGYLRKKLNVEVITYPSSKVPSNISSLFHFANNLFLAFKQLNQKRNIRPPQAVIAMGGYPCFNALLWARLRSVPYFLCESNAVLGKITKLFASRSKAVFLSFKVEPMKNNFIVSGNPVRKEFTSGGKRKSTRPSNSIQKILLIGGSQGARDINSLYLKMIKNPFFSRIKLTLLAGKGNDLRIKSKSKDHRRPHDEIFAFIEDMKFTLESSDLVVARAGGSSLYEILSVRKPAILIPFPHAVYDHQRKNALYLEREGLAKVIDIRPFDVTKVLGEMLAFLKSDSLRKVELNMKHHRLPLDAHENIVDHIIKNFS